MRTHHLKKLVRKADEVLIFISFLEDYVAISKKETYEIIEKYKGRNWEVALVHSSLFIDG